MTGRWPHELSIAPRVPLDRTFPTLGRGPGAARGTPPPDFVGNLYYLQRTLRFSIGGFARYEDAYENQGGSRYSRPSGVPAWASR